MHQVSPRSLVIEHLTLGLGMQYFINAPLLDCCITVLFWTNYSDTPLLSQSETLFFPLAASKNETGAVKQVSYAFNQPLKKGSIVYCALYLVYDKEAFIKKFTSNSLLFSIEEKTSNSLLLGVHSLLLPLATSKTEIQYQSDILNYKLKL